MIKKKSLLLAAFAVVLCHQHMEAKSAKEVAQDDWLYKVGKSIVKFLKRDSEEGATADDFKYMESADKKLVQQKELLLHHSILASEKKKKVVNGLTVIATKMEAWRKASNKGDESAKLAFEAFSPSFKAAAEHQNLLDGLLLILEKERGNFALLTKSATEYVSTLKSQGKKKEQVQEGLQKLYDVFSVYAQQYIIALTRVTDSADAMQNYILVAGSELKAASQIKTPDQKEGVRKKLSDALTKANAAQVYAQNALETYPKVVKKQAQEMKELNAFLRAK